MIISCLAVRGGFKPVCGFVSEVETTRATLITNQPGIRSDDATRGLDLTHNVCRDGAPIIGDQPLLRRGF